MEEGKRDFWGAVAAPRAQMWLGQELLGPPAGQTGLPASPWGVMSETGGADQTRGSGGTLLLTLHGETCDTARATSHPAATAGGGRASGPGAAKCPCWRWGGLKLLHHPRPPRWSPPQQPAGRGGHTGPARAPGPCPPLRRPGGCAPLSTRVPSGRGMRGRGS